MSLLIALEHAELREAVVAIPTPLVISREAAVAVLTGLHERVISCEQAQGWASFVRRGYIANRADGPIQPLDIAYEEEWEEGIAATVSRLDELGAAIDGDISMGEMLHLLQLLADSDRAGS